MLESIPYFSVDLYPDLIYSLDLLTKSDDKHKIWAISRILGLISLFDIEYSPQDMMIIRSATQHIIDNDKYKV
jgi:hypothetical protein